MVDLPTAFFIAAAQLSNGKIVGQLPAGGGTPEQFGLVLDKDSPLTDCVSQAVDALRADGTLAQLATQWLCRGRRAGPRVSATVTVPAETFPVLPDDAGPSDLQRWRDGLPPAPRPAVDVDARRQHGWCSSSSSASRSSGRAGLAAGARDVPRPRGRPGLAAGRSWPASG